MQQTVEAIYENGVLRPLKTLKLTEGEEVQLIVQSKSEIDPRQMLQLAAEVYQDLSDEEIHDIEHIALEN